MNFFQYAIILISLCSSSALYSMKALKNSYKNGTYGNFTLEIHEKEKKRKVPQVYRFKDQTIDGFYFTKHAVERMSERDISSADVIAILKKGKKKKITGAFFYFDYKTRIAVVQSLEKGYIITVYKKKTREKFIKLLDKNPALT